LENLYLDTSWVKVQATKLAVSVCGSHKVLFGSDSPIDGQDTYAFYANYFARDRRLLCKSDWDSVLGKNAVRLFNLQSALDKLMENGVERHGGQRTI